MSTPIAVITVTYSPGTYLESFLDSIPGATEKAAYVVLADNGSTDGVPEQQADKRENVEFFATGGNLGYGTAINRAVQHLKERKERGDIDGDFFVVSNPDVVFDPGSIDAMLECAQRWPGAATIGPRIREADGAAYPSARTVPTIRNGVGHALFGTIWPSNPWTKAYRDDDDLTTEHPAGWLSGSCLLVRWDAFDAIGGFDERCALRRKVPTPRGMLRGRIQPRCCLHITTVPIVLLRIGMLRGGRHHCGWWYVLDSKCGHVSLCILHVADKLAKLINKAQYELRKNA